MKLVINNIALLIGAAFVLNSCTKQETNPIADVRPEIPVSITNAKDYRPDPTVTTSISAGGVIQIDLSIPAESGRTIKEITKIATATSYTKIQGSSTTGLYVATPVSINATAYSFKTSVTEYFSKNPVTGSNPAAKAGNELGLRFYFLVTLDDGSKLVTMPVRVFVLA